MILNSVNILSQSLRTFFLFSLILFIILVNSITNSSILYSQSSKVYESTSTSMNDSIYFNYDDYYSYKKLNSGIKLEFSDSLYYMRFNGKSMATLYTYSFKNYNTIDAIFIRNFDYFRIGNRVNGNFTTNEELITPTHNNIYFVPNLGFDLYDFSVDFGMGYVNRKDEVYFSDGYKIILKFSYSKKNNQDKNIADDDKNNIVFEDEDGDSNSSSNYSMNINYEADNLDTLTNYMVDVGANYSDSFEDDLLNYLGSGNYRTDSYHYLDPSNRRNRVLKNSYRIDNEFTYKINNEIENRSSFFFSQRGKDTYVIDSLNSSNEQITLGLGNQFYVFSNRLLSLFKIEYIDKDETFLFTNSYDTKSREQSSNNFGDYTFKIDTKNRYFYNSNLDLFINSRYLKYENKSLSDNNLNDRDIITFNVNPGAEFYNNNKNNNVAKSKNFSINESFNFSYYHLANISTVKSNNNYKEWVFDNKIDYKYFFTDYLDIGGQVNFKSSYHIYDYDSLYVKSFIIKNYTASDTVKLSFTENLSIKFGARYTYEEFGRVNWDDFVENPERLKNFYYTFMRFIIEDNLKYKFEVEYFFYEIDFYIFNQENFDDYILDNVYIIHGPRFYSKFFINNFEFNSNFTYNFYREKRELVFSLGGSYSW